MSFIFKFKSNNGTYTLFDGAYSFVIETSKYTVIDCAKLTDDDLLTLAQHVFVGEIITLKLIDFYSYVQLRLLIPQNNDNGTSQTFHKISFLSLPNLDLSNTLDTDVYKYTIDGPNTISDIDIIIPEIQVDGSSDIGEPIEVILAQISDISEGFTIRVTIKTFRNLMGGVYFYNESNFTDGTDVEIIPANTKTTWVFQIRDNNLVLLSVTTAGDSPDNDANGYIVNSPFIRFDALQILDSTRQNIAVSNIGAASYEYAQQIENDSFSKYAFVYRHTTSNSVSTTGMYGKGTTIVQMQRSSSNTITISPLDFDTVGGFVHYVVVVRTGTGLTTVDINSIGAPFYGAPAGGLYTLDTQGDSITLMSTRYWTGASYIQYWQCIGRYQQAGSGGGSTALTINTQTGTAYTLSADDNNLNTYLRMMNSNPNEVTIPLTQLNPITIRQGGIGQTTLIADTGVTLIGNPVFASQYDTKTIINIDPGNGWFDIVGSL